MALLIQAKPVAQAIYDGARDRVQKFKAKHGRAPFLAVVLVGEDPASQIYTRRKGEAAQALGFDHETVHLSGHSTVQQVKDAVTKLNHDPDVDGILIQRPLPRGFREEEIVYWIDPAKDVDAFHPENAGRLVLGLPGLKPCTPTGVMALLKHYKIHTEKRVACVIGRSAIVGKPMASLLLQGDATVIQAHSKTPRLAELTQRADILVVAAGQKGLIGAEHVQTGAVVIDVGMHRDGDNKLTGDVRFEEVEKKASAITPVPGGVGPMTIALLLQNTLEAAERRLTESRLP